MKLKEQDWMQSMRVRLQSCVENWRVLSKIAAQVRRKQGGSAHNLKSCKLHTPVKLKLCNRGTPQNWKRLPVKGNGLKTISGRHSCVWANSQQGMEDCWERCKRCKLCKLRRSEKRQSYNNHSMPPDDRSLTIRLSGTIIEERRSIANSNQ